MLKRGSCEIICLCVCFVVLALLQLNAHKQSSLPQEHVKLEVVVVQANKKDLDLAIWDHATTAHVRSTLTDKALETHSRLDFPDSCTCRN